MVLVPNQEGTTSTRLPERRADPEHKTITWHEQRDMALPISVTSLRVLASHQLQYWQKGIQTAGYSRR
jgi:hypothetical protein